MIINTSEIDGSNVDDEARRATDQPGSIDDDGDDDDDGDGDVALVQLNVIEEEENITVEQAFDRLGAGPFQMKILIAAGLCFAADAMQVTMLSFLTLVLKAEWSLSDGMTKSITPCLFAGAMVGTLVLGPAADVVGRRPIYFISALIICVFGIGTSLCTTYWSLLFLVFCVGFGVGGLVVPFDLLAEFLPSSNRGKILLSIEYFWTIGCLYVVLVAYATLHGKPHREDWNPNETGASGEGGHWRTFVALCVVPCMVALVVGYFYVPESARWLVATGRSEEALMILRKGAIANGHQDPYILFPLHIRLHEDLQEDRSHNDGSLAVLFKPQWREITLRIWGTWFGFAFGYYGALLAVTRVFEKKEGTGLDAAPVLSSYDFDYSAIFVSTCAELVGTTLVIVLVDRVGRISSQVGCYLLAGVSVCLLCVFDEWHYPRFVLVGLAFTTRVLEMGGSCTTWVSTAEILTTEVRSTGHSTANAMARLGAFFCPFLVQGNTSLVKIGIIMLLVHLFTVLCVSNLPETKGTGMGGRLADHDEREGVGYSDEAAPEGIINSEERAE